MGFSRTLLGSFTRPGGGGEPLLVPEAVRYWTEHSDRGGLDSWCAALGHSNDRRSFLGRWAAAGSADKYVRTALRVVEGLQLSAARAARAVANGGPDLLGEEQTLELMVDFLQEAGYSYETARLQMLYLESANPELAVPALVGQELVQVDEACLFGTPPAAELAYQPSAPSSPARWVPDARSDASVPATPTQVAASTVGPPEDDEEPEAVLSEVDAQDLEEAKALLTDEEEIAPHGFCIADTAAGVRRLHFVGECGKRPGLHYFSYSLWGDKMPPLELFDKRCKNCFPLFGGEKSLPELETAAIDSDSSTHSASSVEGLKEPVPPAPLGAGVASFIDEP